MSRTTKKTWLMCGTLAAASSLTALGLADEPPAGAPRATRIRVAPVELAQPAAVLRVATVEGGEQELVSEYWLGIVFGPLPDITKDQLGIEHGLAVGDVTPDSPAAKAGVKKHDILTKAGDTALKTPGDLLKAVSAAKENELALIVLRGGKEMTIKATPVKRAEAIEALKGKAYELRAPKGEIREEIKRLEEALQNLKTKAGGESLGLFFARPGVVAPQYALPKAAELPKGMALSITKEADKPIKIHVKKDEKEWDVSEDKLDELPADVRKEVEKAIQGMSARGITAAMVRSFVGGPKVAPLPPAATPVPPVPPAPPAAPNKVYSYRVEAGGGNLEGKLDTIMTKLDELRKDVDELRGKK